VAQVLMICLSFVSASPPFWQ